jgi:hypothetical protein
VTDAAGYSGTALPRKLGIVEGTRVLLLGAPEGFDLGPLPGIELHRRAGRSPYDVVLLFAPDRASLVRRFAPARDRISVAGALWACWPKRASGVATDLTDNVVRAHGLATGLVDVKVAAIDATWSGIKFVVRLRDRPASGSA